MKSLQILLAGLMLVTCSATLFGQQSTVYLSVLSTKLFVVGAANPQTGLFYRKGSDTVWQHTGAPNIRAFGLAVHTPSKGSLLCIASGNGVHKSTDGGATWKITTGWDITEVQSVVIDQSNPQLMYCTTPYGVYRTLDGGTTWKECNNGIAMKFTSSLIIDQKNSNVLYCATDAGVYRSDDRGDTWKRTGLAVSRVRVVVQHPANPDVLVAGTDNDGIYISRNAGKYWDKTEAGLDHSTFYAIVFDPTNPQVLYAGGYVTGVYKSTDGGTSWTRKNDGLTTLNIHSLAVDPANGSRLYAGTHGGGIFQSDDAGNTWRNVGLSGSQVWTLSVQSF
jgi:photosystem II stability/assembly factor-like uncharacterized protein